MAQFHGPGPRTSDNVVELEVLDLPRRPAAASARRRRRPCPRRSRDRLRALADRYGDLIRARYPKIPRRVSGYNLDELLPENGFNVARALVGTEGTCVTILEATVAADRQPAVPLARRRRATRTSATAADHVPRCSSTGRLGLEGVDDTLVEDMTLLGMHRHDLSHAARRAAAGSLVEFGGDTKEEADEQARAIMADAREGRRRAARHEALRRPGRASSTSGRCARPGSARRRSSRASPTRTRAGRTRPCRPSGSASTCARSSKLATRYGYESALYGHYGQGCVHARWNFDLVDARRASRRGGASSTRRPTSCSRSAARSPASTATASRGPSSCRRCSGRARRGVPRVQVDLGSRLEDEPGQGRRPVPDRREPPARRRLPAAAGRDPFAYPQRRRQLRARDDALRRHRQVPAHDDGGVMCPSFMVTREEKHSTRGRAHLLLEMLNGERARAAGARRGAARRSTSASRARAARATARSTSTCRRSRPSSSPTTTRTGCARAHAYAFGLIDRWARLAVARAGARQRRHADAGLRGAREARRRGVARSGGCRRSRRRRCQRLVHRTRAGPREPGRARGHPLAGHVHEPLRARRRRRGGRGARGAPASASTLPRGPRSAAGGRSTTTASSTSPGATSSACLDALRDEIRAGTPIVGLEPSCVAVFKRRAAEAAAARRGRAAALQADVPPRRVPPPAGRLRAAAARARASSCTATATPRDRRLRARARAADGDGREVETPDTGCCGMAGALGLRGRRTTTSRVPAPSACSSRRSARRAPETVSSRRLLVPQPDRAARSGPPGAAPRRGARRSSHRPSRPRPTPARRCRTLLKLGPPSTLRASPEISSRPRPDRLRRAPRAPRPPRP